MNVAFQGSERFEAAMARFDQENSQDPNLEFDGKRSVPRELLYARRLAEWVLQLEPAASEPLRLAARCQHLCRWQIPRRSFPMTRAGYLQWRERLKRFHAEKSAEILRQCGYDDAVVERVAELNLKRNLARDPECQVLEDALCLVFLQYQFAALASKTEPATMLSVVQKTWAKMSAKARDAARSLSYGPAEQQLLTLALGSTGRDQGGRA